jgi:hypothetical protein
MSFFRRARPVLSEEGAREIARAEVSRRDWLWEEPARAWTTRRGFFFGGPLRWEVMTNAGHIGNNVWVTIDDATGEVRSANFVPR